MGKNFKYQLGCGCACSTSQETVPFCNENNNEPCVLLDNASSSDVWICLNEQLVKHFNKECPAKFLIYDITPNTTYTQKNTDELDSLIGENSYVIEDNLDLNFSDVFFQYYDSSSDNITNSVPDVTGITNLKIQKNSWESTYYTDREKIQIGGSDLSSAYSTLSTDNVIVFPVEDAESKAQEVYNSTISSISLNEDSSYFVTRCNSDLHYIHFWFWFPRQNIVMTPSFVENIDDDLAYIIQTDTSEDSYGRYTDSITIEGLQNSSSQYLSYSLDKESVSFQLFSIQLSGDDITQRYLHNEKIVFVETPKVELYVDNEQKFDSFSSNTMYGNYDSDNCIGSFYPYKEQTSSLSSPTAAKEYTSILTRSYPVTLSFTQNTFNAEYIEQLQQIDSLVTSQVQFNVNINFIWDYLFEIGFQGSKSENSGVRTYLLEPIYSTSTGKPKIIPTVNFSYNLPTDGNFFISVLPKTSYPIWSYGADAFYHRRIELSDDENSIIFKDTGLTFAYSESKTVATSSYYNDGKHYELGDRTLINCVAQIIVPKSDFYTQLNQVYHNLCDCVSSFNTSFSFREKESMQGYVPYELHEPTDEDSYFTDFTLCEG